MALAFVNNKLFAGTLNGGTSSATDMTGANLLLSYIVYASTISVTYSDSLGNTYTLRTRQACNDGGAGAGNASQIADTSGTVPTVSSTMTFSIAGNGSVGAIYTMGWSGAALNSFERESTAGQNNAGTGTSIQPGSITPALNNELVVAGCGNSSTSSATVNGGFTMTDTQARVAATHYGGGFAYLIQTAAAAANPTFSFSTGINGQTAAIASYRMKSPTRRFFALAGG